MLTNQIVAAKLFTLAALTCGPSPTPVSMQFDVNFLPEEVSQSFPAAISNSKNGSFELRFGKKDVELAFSRTPVEKTATYCLSLQKATLHLTITPVIYVNSKFDEQSCVYGKVRDFYRARMIVDKTAFMAGLPSLGTSTLQPVSTGWLSAPQSINELILLEQQKKALVSATFAQTYHALMDQMSAADTAQGNRAIDATSCR